MIRYSLYEDLGRPQKPRTPVDKKDRILSEIDQQKSRIAGLSFDPKCSVKFQAANLCRFSRLSVDLDLSKVDFDASATAA
jgi:hypothetical protein